MMNPKYSHISFEGERGTGKTTVINSILNDIENSGLRPLLNRKVNAEYTLDEQSNSRRSIELYNLWLEQFVENDDGTIETMDTEMAERLAFERFHNIVINLLWEGYKYAEIVNNFDVFICDRDLDTVVAYGAVEIILSNPTKYESLDSRNSLVNSLWAMVLSVREPAEITFYLTSFDLNSTLSRSYLSKIDTPNEYHLTSMQASMQVLVKTIFPIVLQTRRTKLPDNKIIQLNVDGKRQDEVFSAIRREITTCRYNTRTNPSKNLLSLRYTTEFGIPSSIEELIEIIMKSSTGAAFPSYEEVKELGFSNCVYSNAALAYYSHIFGVGNIDLVSVSRDSETNASSVHWVCIEYIDEDTVRIIDLSPFNKTPLIGKPSGFVRTDHDSVILTYDDELDEPTQYLAREVEMERPRFAFELMQFAFDVHEDRDHDKLIQTGLSLIRRSKNESQKVFATIRYIRVLERLEQNGEIISLIENLKLQYRYNLILGREIARLTLKGILISGADQYLKECLVIITNAYQRRISRLDKPNISEHTFESVKSFINYYSWIYTALEIDIESIYKEVLSSFALVTY